MRFVWVRHYDTDSLKRIKAVLKEFQPDIIGLELSMGSLKRLLQYKKRDKSELYFAYKYAKGKGLEYVLMDEGREELMQKLFRELGLLGLLKILLWFVLKNVQRLLHWRMPKKLQPQNCPVVAKYFIKERDKLFVGRIKELVHQNPGKRILFIFGEGHKEGILAGLEQANKMA